MSVLNLPGQLVLQFLWVGGVELDRKIHVQVSQAYGQLFMDRLLQIQPVLRALRVEVFESKVVQFYQIQRLANLIEQRLAQCFLLW